MPRPFPTPEELVETTQKKGFFAWVRRWFTREKSVLHRNPEGDAGPPPTALPSVDPPRPDPPVIVPDFDGPNTDPGRGRQWIAFLRTRGAAPRGMVIEEVRAGLMEDILHETSHAQTPIDNAFLQRLAKVLINSDLHLPPFPAIARELDGLLFKGDPSVLDVTSVVERDPGLVREIWSRASGANFRRPPSKLDEAISRVGFTELWRVAMQMAMQSPVFRAGHYQAEAEAIHEHGTMCAEVAAQIAREPRGSAYLAGLLHDVGKLIIFRAAGGLKESPSPILMARILQNHHSAIGMVAARAWNLGPDIEQAIGFHHHPTIAQLAKPGPLGPTAMAEAALQIAAAERNQTSPSRLLERVGELPVAVPGFVDLPEELREAVLAAHRLMDTHAARAAQKPSKK